MLRGKIAIIGRRNALESLFAILTESGIAFTLLWVRNQRSLHSIVYTDLLMTRLQVIYLFSDTFFSGSKAFFATMTIVMTIAAVRGQSFV